MQFLSSYCKWNWLQRFQNVFIAMLENVNSSKGWQLQCELWQNKRLPQLYNWELYYRLVQMTFCHLQFILSTSWRKTWRQAQFLFQWSGKTNCLAAALQHFSWRSPRVRCWVLWRATSWKILCPAETIC